LIKRKIRVARGFCEIHIIGFEEIIPLSCLRVNKVTFIHSLVCRLDSVENWHHCIAAVRTVIYIRIAVIPAGSCPTTIDPVIFAVVGIVGFRVVAFEGIVVPSRVWICSIA
jgi:hypothetical protein